MPSKDKIRIHRLKKTTQRFRNHCLELIAHGYQALDRHEQHDKEEPAVTGNLIQEINKYFDSPNSPEWVSNYSIHDDPPINADDAEGKSRSRTDIKFELAENRPRIHLHFEAKWVGNEKTSLGSKKGYLGEEGIGCFLSGKYPTKIGQVGMLAYLHSDNENIWAEKIEALCKEKVEELHIAHSDENIWEPVHCDSLPHVFQSRHDCPPPVGTISVTHVLLDFT